MNAIGRRLYERIVGPQELSSHETIVQSLRDAAATIPSNTFSERFLLAEWQQVIDAWQVMSWEDYRDVPRLGRKTRLPERARVVLWSIFEKVQQDLRRRGLLTYAGLFTKLADKIAQSAHPTFEYAVIDECQDVSIAELRIERRSARNALGTRAGNR
jgi:hypothetical protein